MDKLYPVGYDLSILPMVACCRTVLTTGFGFNSFAVMALKNSVNVLFPGMR
jgi:hypothetical protein